MNSRLLSLFAASSLFAVTGGGYFFGLPLMADQNITPSVQIENHRQAIEEWRAKRHERLTQPNGWLTLVGLEWLEDGENRIGSAADNDIHLSGGPAYWGSVFLRDDKLLFKTADLQNVTINPGCRKIIIGSDGRCPHVVQFT